MYQIPFTCYICLQTHRKNGAKQIENKQQAVRANRARC